MGLDQNPEYHRGWKDRWDKGGAPPDNPTARYMKGWDDADRTLYNLSTEKDGQRFDITPWLIGGITLMVVLYFWFQFLRALFS